MPTQHVAILTIEVPLPTDHKRHGITADLAKIGEAAKEQFEKDHPECKDVTMTCEPVRKTGPKVKATASTADATKAADAALANAAPAVEPMPEPTHEAPEPAYTAALKQQGARAAGE
jgi:hypothetical protein